MHCNWKMKAIIPKESSRENESWRCEGVERVKLVLNQRVLCIKATLIEGNPSIKVVKNMLEKVRMLRVGLMIEKLLINPLWHNLKMFSLKLFAPISHKNITLLRELPIEDKYNKLMSNPIISFDILQLLILPFHHITIISVSYTHLTLPTILLV